MAKKSSAYWQKRFSALENAQNQYGQNTFHQIEPAFDKAERQIQAQIEAWYARYASNNGITLAEARKQLSAVELKELQWDVQEYIKYGQENAMNQQWMKELENASARFHISRLEALKLRTQQSLEVAFGNELDSLDGMVKRLYQSGYYHTCFEVQKGFNIGWEIGQIDERKLQKVISKPWAADGKTFSDRVWQSKTTMVNELHQQMTRTIIQGKAPDEAIKSMTKYLQNKTKNAKYNAGRLVMTEQAFISSAAQKDAFNDLDVEEFEIVATLDSHTSDICREMDGKHFPMKDFQPGVTAPPFHVWCRSTTVPYFDDEWGRSGERAARGEDGKTYYVPADMTYPEWEKAMVDGQTDDLKPAVPDGTMKVEEVHWSDMTQGDTFQNKKEAFKHFEDAGIHISDSKKYPMDAEISKGMATWHSKFTKNFADFDAAIKSKLPYIKNVAPSSLPGNRLGDFTYYTGSGKVVGIRLNSGLHSTLDYASKVAEKSFESHWHSGKNPLHTIIHEYGHYVSHSMSMLTKSSFEHDIIQEALQEYKKLHPEYEYETYIGLKDALSRYGSTKEAECFAEAFAEYFGEEEPREFATIFGHLLEQKMKGVKKP
jgi:SPP1 gp7 family putative phage head morphogenesis protein